MRLRPNDRVTVPEPITCDLPDGTVTIRAGTELVVLEVRDSEIRVLGEDVAAVWVPAKLVRENQ